MINSRSNKLDGIHQHPHGGTTQASMQCLQRHRNRTDASHRAICRSEANVTPRSGCILPGHMAPLNMRIPCPPLGTVRPALITARRVWASSSCLSTRNAPSATCWPIKGMHPSRRVTPIILSDRPSLCYTSPRTRMPVQPQVLENLIREAIPVSHLEIHDQSNGCGENYSIVVVSEVSVH